jgi:hypothetical protein
MNIFNLKKFLLLFSFLIISSNCFSQDCFFNWGGAWKALGGSGGWVNHNPPGSHPKHTPTTKNNPSNSKGGGADEDYDFGDLDDYDYDYEDGDDYTSFDDFFFPSGTGTFSDCLKKAKVTFQNVVTWSNFAQNMGMTKFNYTGIITPFQRDYFNQNISLLCDENKIILAIKACEAVEACMTAPPDASLDQAVDWMSNYFANPAVKADYSTQNILNCYYIKTIGSTFANCVFPKDGLTKDFTTLANAFALEEYLKANPLQIAFANSSEFCNIVKNGTIPKGCTIDLKTETKLMPNNGRLRIGLRETITISIDEGIKGCPTATANWKVIPKIPNAKYEIDASGKFITIKAGFLPEKIKVIAEIGGISNCNCVPIIIKEKEIEIVAPNGIFAEKNYSQCQDLCLHEECKPSAGFQSNIYLTPNDVNFYNIRVKEFVANNFDKTKPEDGCTGNLFKCADCPVHTPNDEYTEMKSFEQGKGTLIGTDLAYLSTGKYCHGVTVTFDYLCDTKKPGISTITWHCLFAYLNEDINKGIEFANYIQEGVHTGGNNDPVFKTSKFGLECSRQLQDKSTDCFGKIKKCGDCSK